MNIRLKALAVCVAVATLAGCADVEPLRVLKFNFSVAGVQPGTSVAKDVETKMGQPAEKLSLPDGSSAWFYPRQRAERQTVAVRFSSDGVVRSVEETLEPELLRRIVPATSTSRQVRELIGPPVEVVRVPNLEREAWRYLVFDAMHIKQVLELQFSADGILRLVTYTRDRTEASGAY